MLSLFVLDRRKLNLRTLIQRFKGEEIILGIPIGEMRNIFIDELEIPKKEEHLT